MSANNLSQPSRSFAIFFLSFYSSRSLFYIPRPPPRFPCPPRPLISVYPSDVSADDTKIHWTINDFRLESPINKSGRWFAAVVSLRNSWISGAGTPSGTPGARPSPREISPSPSPLPPLSQSQPLTNRPDLCAHGFWSSLTLGVVVLQITEINIEWTRREPLNRTGYMARLIRTETAGWTLITYRLHFVFILITH